MAHACNETWHDMTFNAKRVNGSGDEWKRRGKNKSVKHRYL